MGHKVKKMEVSSLESQLNDKLRKLEFHQQVARKVLQLGEFLGKMRWGL